MRQDWKDQSHVSRREFLLNELVKSNICGVQNRSHSCKAECQHTVLEGEVECSMNVFKVLHQSQIVLEIHLSMVVRLGQDGHSIECNAGCRKLNEANWESNLFVLGNSIEADEKGGESG